MKFNNNFIRLSYFKTDYAHLSIMPLHTAQIPREKEKRCSSIFWREI